MIISVIAAIAKNRAIGYQNKLIYHIKEDMKRFQTLTMDHPIIMGRKTFESLPHGPLPGRRNIIVSTTLDVVAGAEVAKSLDDALKFLKNEDEVFIIGGASLYEEAVSK
jgi:dihydrofolate reductase